MEKQLPTDVRLLIEAQVANEKRETLTAYVLWFFFGTLGIHHRYLGRMKDATRYLIAGAVGWTGLIFGVSLGSSAYTSQDTDIAMAVLIVGLVGLGLVGICLLLDLFRLPGYVDAYRAAVRERLVKEYEASGSV
ncbi:TM2 domain-containing protein [Sutterella sp.]|uniref:TM2 domain-containing protein n=1 Tax=Sutterella sp. TaxID=1981025 RepID=UPI0026DFCB7D|nr:TM2 domain-containing protein [Sutterella sp.]MDO5532893.1 TM2 domain-containing protein [Sutterella sp.]